MGRRETSANEQRQASSSGAGAADAAARALPVLLASGGHPTPLADVETGATAWTPSVKKAFGHLEYDLDAVVVQTNARPQEEERRVSFAEFEAQAPARQSSSSSGATPTLPIAAANAPGNQATALALAGMSASPATGRSRRGARTPGDRTPSSRALTTQSAMTVGTVAGYAAHGCYYMLAFFAYWFGGRRFSPSGDDEFDPTDVQRMINNVALHLHFSFSRPKPRRRQLKVRLQAREQKAQEDQQEEDFRQRAHEEVVQELRDQIAQHQGGHAALGLEHALHGMETAIFAAKDVIDADVVGRECVETTIRDNLRQYLPWFSIGQVLICFGLWIGFALRSNLYTFLGHNLVFDESPVLAHAFGIGLYDCEVRCSREEGCAGVAHLQGPAPECKLLGALPDALVRGSGGGCQGSTWNWSLYRKQPRTVGSLFGTRGGLETAFPGETSLQSYDYCEDGFQASFFWRAWSYQWTHGGLSHVGSNCMMLMFLGVPLEGFHGTGLTALMYTFGVYGGGLSWMLFDPYSKGYGASGGCFALLGMHVADLLLNWKQKKFRFPVLVLLAAIVSVELAGSISAASGETSNVAHSVHSGGFVSGLVVGIVLSRNIDQKRCKKALQIIVLVVGAGLICFCLVWWFTNPFPGIKTLWSPSEGPYCWIGQVCTNADNTGCDYNMGWQCVLCDTRECVEKWYKDQNTFCTLLGSERICGGAYIDITHNCHNC